MTPRTALALFLLIPAVGISAAALPAAQQGKWQTRVLAKAAFEPAQAKPGDTVTLALTVDVQPHGGHCGFIHRPTLRSWIDDRITQLLT